MLRLIAFLVLFFSIGPVAADDPVLTGQEAEAQGDPRAQYNFEQLGLTKDWVVRIVRQVGNYGEVFERNVGTGSKLGISRGINRLWTKGGIQYAPPVR